MSSPLLFTHKDLIKQWFQRSQGKKTKADNIFDKFISLWFSFNAWGNYQTNTITDSKMINQLKTNYELQQTYAQLICNNKDFHNIITRLQRFQVLDMRYPNRRGKSITDINKFDEVLEIIYQVRCNLFHGKKRLNDSHDKELVEISYTVLTRLFGPVVKQI